MHMSQFPNRNWAIILQQVWSMYLKDRWQRDDSKFHASNHNSSRPKKEICKRFNEGKCTNGVSCKYDHQCEVKECGKFGHGAHICRKRTNTEKRKHSTHTGNS